MMPAARSKTIGTWGTPYLAGQVFRNHCHRAAVRLDHHQGHQGLPIAPAAATPGAVTPPTSSMEVPASVNTMRPDNGNLGLCRRYNRQQRNAQKCC